MNKEEFIFWLKGFLEVKKQSIDFEDIKIINEKINSLIDDKKEVYYLNFIDYKMKNKSTVSSTIDF